MIYGLYHSAAGMMTSEYRQNVIANNLANAETIGFKQEVAVFAERTPASVAGWRSGPSAAEVEGLSGYLWLGRTHTDFGQGAMIHTDRATDLALDGPGFLVVEAGGQPQYTRDGRLIKGADGVLRAATDGAPVLGVGGVPLRLNPHGGEVTFDEDGRVLQDGVVRGRLALVDFADYRALRKAGGARFVQVADDPRAGRPDESAPYLREGFGASADLRESSARVVSRHLESSAVEPVRELVDMIAASRAYELNARMIGLQDQSVGRLIGTLAR